MSPLFKTEVESAKDRARATALKTLLEANARWNETRKETFANDLRRVVDETSTINPELRKELLYYWQYGFIEDKPEEAEFEISGSPNLLRKDENGKSGKALTNPLKGKVQSETPHTMKTATGAVYRKTDMAKAKIATSKQKEKNPKKGNTSRNPHGDEPKSKSTKKANDKQPANSDLVEIPDSPEKSTKAATLFQDGDYNITSKDTEVNGVSIFQ